MLASLELMLTAQNLDRSFMKVGEAAGALQVLFDEGVAVCVGLKEAVPPGEVQGSVVAAVHVVDVVGFGGGSPGGEAHTAGQEGMEP